MSGDALPAPELSDFRQGKEERARSAASQCIDYTGIDLHKTTSTCAASGQPSNSSHRHGRVKSCTASLGSLERGGSCLDESEKGRGRNNGHAVKGKERGR